MAKKKSVDDTDSVTLSQNESINKLSEELISKYGEGIIIPASDIMDKPKKCLSISPSIDIGVGGGISEGSWCGLAGPPSCGKTTLALTIARNGQLDGRPVFYLNVEARLKTMNLLGISNLDIDKMRVINYVENQSLTGENFLDAAEKIITNVKNAIIIIDSVSSLCPTSEMTVDVTGSIRPTTPKMLSHFIRKNTGKVYINNSIVIMIHHVITNTSGYGAKWQISDGVKVNFQADIRLQAKGTPVDWMEGETQVGQIVEWEIAKASNAASIGSAKSYIRYGVGIDNAAETFNLCCDYGIIKKAGAWFSSQLLTKEGDEKIFQTQGQERFLRHLNENAQDLQKLELALHELV